MNQHDTRYPDTVVAQGKAFLLEAALTKIEQDLLSMITVLLPVNHHVRTEQTNRSWRVRVVGDFDDCNQKINDGLFVYDNDVEINERAKLVERQTDWHDKRATALALMLAMLIEEHKLLCSAFDASRELANQKAQYESAERLRKAESVHALGERRLEIEKMCNAAIAHARKVYDWTDEENPLPAATIINANDGSRAVDSYVFLDLANRVARCAGSDTNVGLPTDVNLKVVFDFETPSEENCDIPF